MTRKRKSECSLRLQKAKGKGPTVEATLAAEED
jgi:hypothetical protein